MKDPLVETYEGISKRIEEWEKGKKSLDQKNLSEEDLRFFEGVAEVLETYASNDNLRTVETVEGEYKKIPESEREKLKDYAHQLKQVVNDIKTRNQLDEIGNKIVIATNAKDKKTLDELPKKIEKIEDNAGYIYYQLEDVREDVEKGRYQSAFKKLASAKTTFEKDVLKKHDIPYLLLRTQAILKFGKESII